MAKINIARQQTLEEENRILKEKLAEQEKKNQESVEALGGHIANEIRNIRRKGGPAAGTITVIEKNDHRNILLYTKWGSRIGPLHPDNAIQTLHRFADIGIMLSAIKPTAEQVEAYAQTKEYKDMIIRNTERRAAKDKSKRTGGVDRLIAAMEKQYGLQKSDLVGILKPAEMKS